MCCGALTDRLAARDSGWQLGTALLGTASSIPFGLAFYLWPTGIALQLGSLSVPTALFFYFGFAFFGTWWSVPCFSALSHLIPASRLAQGTALFFMGVTLLGAGLGPLVVGGLSDLFSRSMGIEALRYALASTLVLLVLPCLCLAIAVPRYRRQVDDHPATAPAGAVPA